MRLVPTNPMNKVLAAILLFEAICAGLAIPGMIQVSNIPIGLAFGLGGALLVLCLAAAGTLRRPVGWPLAWAAQAGGVALGLVVDMMYAVGGMFLLLFVLTFVLGKRLESAATPG